MAYQAKPKPYVGISITHTDSGECVCNRHASFNNLFIGRIDMPEQGHSLTEFFFVKLPQEMVPIEGLQWILDNANHYPRVFNDPKLQAWMQSEINAATGADKEKEVQIIIEEPVKENSNEDAQEIKNQQLRSITEKFRINNAKHTEEENDEDIPEFLRREA